MIKSSEASKKSEMIKSYEMKEEHHRELFTNEIAISWKKRSNIKKCKSFPHTHDTARVLSVA